MAFLKPQNPMTKGSDYFYPLTTADQVIMDGGYRLDEIVGKTKKSTIMLYANGWSAEAPYCYSVTVQGLSDKVNMKMLPHFPEDFEGKQAMKEETAKISFATREGNILTFECWDEVPTMDLPIDIEIEAMYPIKGASIEMNYSVVGGVEEPAEPSENMIWVNTDQDITDWVFSKNEPKNPEEGMIWFTTGDDSNVSFFTLRMDKREFDEVYPISAKQYANGVWIDKITKSYQNGEWIEWFPAGTLYWKGYEFINITGGWTNASKKSSSSSSITAAAPTITRYDDYLHAEQASTSERAGIIYLVNKIDLTNYSMLVAEGEFCYTGTYSGNCYMAVWTELGTYISQNQVSIADFVGGTKTRLEINVSALEGKHTIGFSIVTNGPDSTAATGSYVKLSKLYLE